MKKAVGLTLIEVVMALSILALTLTAFFTLTLSSIRQNQVSGSRTQAVQVMNYIGRRVTGADSVVSPLAATPTSSWTYGQLRTAFPDLAQATSLVSPDFYRASVTNRGLWNGASVTLAQFRIIVCWRASGGEKCVQSDTLAANPDASSTDPGQDLGN